MDVLLFINTELPLLEKAKGIKSNSTSSLNVLESLSKQNPIDFVFLPVSTQNPSKRHTSALSLLYFEVLINFLYPLVELQNVLLISSSLFSSTNCLISSAFVPSNLIPLKTFFITVLAESFSFTSFIASSVNCSLHNLL